MNKRIRVARRANLPLSYISLTNKDNLLNLIGKDIGTEITSKLYYPKVFNSENSIKSEKKLRDLVLRNMSKVTRYKGFSVSQYLNKEGKKIGGLNISPNLNWLRKVASIVACNQDSDSNLKFSLNYEYEISGTIFVWQIPRRNRNDVFIHIKKNSILGKLIELFRKQGCLTYKQIMQYFDGSKSAKLLIEYLIKYSIIFSELNNNQVTLDQILCFTKNKYLASLRKELKEINKSFNKLSNEPSLLAIDELRKLMDNICYEDDALTLNRWEYVAEKDKFNLPKELKLLFRLMGTLDKSYQNGRAYRKWFEDKYGFYKKVPVKKALFINNPKKFNSAVKPYLLDDKLFLNINKKWNKIWLNLLSKHNNSILNLTHDNINELIKLLSPLQDHVGDSVSCHLFYSRMADNSISLPFFALQPTFFQKGKVSISYFANNFPEVDEKDASKNKLYLNQFTPDSSYSLDRIFLVLTRKGLQFINDDNEILKLNWGSILETKVKGESQFLTRLKGLCDYMCQFPINTLPPFYDSLYHIPKIMYKNISICPEMWNFELDDLKQIEEDKSLFFIENGTFFPLLNDEKFSVDKFYTVTPRVKYKGDFVKQNIDIISFGNVNEDTSSIKLEKLIQRKSSKYRSYNLLLPNPDYEFYITELVNLLSDQKGVGQYFFMRYFDQDFPSIRLRLRKNDKNLSLILAKFCNKNGIKLIDSTYFPETNRYGDGKLLEKIEEEFENESKNYLKFCKNIRSLNTLDARVYIELNFVVRLKNILSQREIMKLYKDFRNNNYVIKFDKQFVSSIFNNLSDIFKLSRENWNFERFTYNYFSLVHMAQNRLLGSNYEEEEKVHSIVKKLIRGGEYEKMLSDE